MIPAFVLSKYKIMATQEAQEIPDTVFYFEDWNDGLGRKYIIMSDFTKPIPNPNYNEKDTDPHSSAYDKFRGYEEIRKEVPR